MSISIGFLTASFLIISTKGILMRTCVIFLFLGLFVAVSSTQALSMSDPYSSDGLSYVQPTSDGKDVDDIPEIDTTGD